MKLRWFAAAAVIAAPATVAHAQTTPAQTTPAQTTPAQTTRAPAPPAQRPSQPAKPSEGNTVQGVTVTAQGNETRTSIDRRSYSVANDLQATTGSIGDALRNIPSVDVDVQGNISLRGDSNVTIMIDGKPSGMFRGESRATALQQLPADQIERVEVMTNPSAAFRPDGSAGVINLITKKGKGVGRTGSLRGNLGTDGRYNGSGSLSYNGPKLSVTSDVGVRHDVGKQEYTDERSRYFASRNTWVDSLSRGEGRQRNDSANGRVSIDYDVDPKLRISGELRTFQLRGRNENTSHFEGLDPSSTFPQTYDQASDIRVRFGTTEASASFRRKFSGFEHELTGDISQERTSIKFGGPTTYVASSPAWPDPFERMSQSTSTDKTEGKLEYKKPVGDDDKLVVGYSFELTDNDYDNIFGRGPTAGSIAPLASLTNKFNYRQVIQAGYGTYQHKFGDLTALVGVRAEHTGVDIDQITSNIQASNDYWKVYPSLHLAYDLAEGQQLTASYSHRVVRPQPQDLNPYRQYANAYNYRQGNPFLKPQDTDSFELGYQYRKQATFYMATLFWRQIRGGVTDVVSDLGGGVFLTTKENIGEARNGGLELVANSRLNPKLSLSLNSTIYWNEIDVSNLGFGGKRSGYTFQGGGALNWTATPNDFVQLQARGMGERLTAQGHVGPRGMVNLGYRHKFNNKLSMTLTGQDLFGTMRNDTYIDTPILRAQTKAKFSQRAVFVGLTYTFASGSPKRPARDPGFDFDSGGGGAGPM